MRANMKDYVHGYSEREAERLQDQANSVKELIHHDTGFPPGSLVLEVGCGVGAQTLTIASQSPGARIISFDKSLRSVSAAARRVRPSGLENVHLLGGDLFAAPFRPASFDCIFVSYLLEHMIDPVAALTALSALLRPGGIILVVEGDHGSCFFHPSTPEAVRAWNCLIHVQDRLGGDSLIGRRLQPLLQEAGFEDAQVSPRMVYADQRRPEVQEAFVLRTIVPMVEGVRDEALERGLMSASDWDKGLADLRRTGSSPEGTFCYTFFKAQARARSRNP